LIVTDIKLIACSTGFAVYACQHIPSTQSEVLGRQWHSKITPAVCPHTLLQLSLGAQGLQACAGD
jgi:hypothetical protein